MFGSLITRTRALARGGAHTAPTRTTDPTRTYKRYVLHSRHRWCSETSSIWLLLRTRCLPLFAPPFSPLLSPLLSAFTYRISPFALPRPSFAWPPTSPPLLCFSPPPLSYASLPSPPLSPPLRRASFLRVIVPWPASNLKHRAAWSRRKTLRSSYKRPLPSPLQA
jgi:hypothetical protein